MSRLVAFFHDTIVDLPRLNKREEQYDISFFILCAVFFHYFKDGSSLYVNKLPPNVFLKEFKMLVNFRLRFFNGLLLSLALNNIIERVFREDFFKLNFLRLFSHVAIFMVSVSPLKIAIVPCR